MQYKILLVDNDIEITQNISQLLVANGYCVEIEHCDNKLAEHISAFQPDLITLDIMLPGAYGLMVCQKIRENFSGTIMMLTELYKEIHEINSLEYGADEYLCKPITPTLFLAHIRAKQRQKMARLKIEGFMHADAGNLVINTAKRSVFHRGKELKLTTAEFEILTIMARSAGKVTSREALHSEIYNFSYDGLERPIDLRVSRLRKKLGDTPKSAKVIKTIRNKGYLLAS